MLTPMSDALLWTGAIGGAVAAAGGIAAAVGAWRSEVTARWQARVERLRTDTARNENALHRQRFAEVWNWWHKQADGPKRSAAVRWYYEWSGAGPPFDPGADGPLAPGVGSADADDAYARYVDFLSALYQPGRLGPPRPKWKTWASERFSGQAEAGQAEHRTDLPE